MHSLLETIPRSRPRLAAFGALAVAAAALLAPAAGAQAGGGAPPGGFGARPALGGSGPQQSYFTPRLRAGGTYRGSVVVTSTSGAPIHLLAYPVDGTTGATSGAVYTNRGDGLRGAGAWISLPAGRLTLPAHGTVRLPFAVHAPTDAAAGDHLAGIALERAPTTSSAGSFALRNVLRTVVGVLVRVPGSGAFQPELGSVSLGAAPGSGAASVAVEIADAGNRLGKPELAVRLDGPGGYARTVATQLDTILPGDRIAYRLPWPDGLPQGAYTITVRATGGARAVETHARVVLGQSLRSAAAAPAAPRRLPTGWGAAAAAVALALLGLLVVRQLARRVAAAALRIAAAAVAALRAAGRALSSPRARTAVVATAVLCAVGGVLVGAAPGRAAGSLTNTSVTLSASVAGATGVAYTYSFTTATSMSLTAITMTVPSGTGGTPALGTLSFPYGQKPSGGSIVLSGTTLTYSFSSFYVASGATVSIQVTGLTNTGTPGSYTATVATIGPDYQNGGSKTIDQGTSSAFSISGGSLTSVGWSTSSGGTNATGVSYTYTFTTATAATLQSVTMSVPAGTGGSPSLGSVSGLPGGGSVSLSGTTLTYGGFSQSVAGGTAVTIRIDGLTNTSTAGSYTSAIATASSGGPVDTGTSSSVSFTGGVLGSPIWSLSDSASGATGVAYTYSFTVGTSANVTSISMSVPNGTAGTPTVGPISSTYSSLPTNGTVTLSGTTLTYSFASHYLGSGYTVSIEIDGLTNTGTTGSYTAQLTTSGTGGPVDTATTGAISITGGTLSGAVWSVSNTGVGATGVDYTYTFTTASAATLSSVTMSVPPGTAGTPAVGTVTGLPAGGSISLASNTLTYSFAATAVAAATAVSIDVSGLTNTSSAGSYTSQLTTHSGSGPIDTGLTAAVSITATSLSSPVWSISSSTAGATGVTYSYSFSTASSTSISKVTMSVPPGTAGTPTLTSVSGVPAGGTLSLASNTLTYSFTGGWVGGGTAVSIVVGGLTNTTSTGTYTSQIATKNRTTPVDTGTTAAVSISGGALTGVSWSVSNSASGATGVTYTYRLTTASSATLTKVTASVPPGTAGTPALGTVANVPANGTLSLASNTLTYTFPGTAVASGTTITIQVGGLTNTTTTGSYTSALATRDASGPVDTGSSGSVSFSGGALSSPIWNVSASGSGATGVTYGYSFTTASGASLASITMSVPPGTAGTPAVGTITSTYSSLPTNGTATLSGTTLTYSFATTYINPSTAVSIQFTGLTNTTSPGSYTAQITTHTGAGAPVDTGTTAAIAFSGAALASPIWSVSSFATGATGTTYGYTFTTASNSPLDSVTMTVPPGTAGTPVLANVSGLPSGGTVFLASNTLTYSFPLTAVAANTAVSISFSGLTNTTTVGSYTSQITTNDGIDPIDAGLTAAVSISGASLTNQTWTLGRYAAGATGVAYTYSFTTASGATLAGITMSVPPGTTGTPAVGSVTSTNNAVPTNGTVSLSGNTLTYAFGGQYVSANYTVTIVITGLTNTATPGSYTSQISTRTSSAPVDAGVTPTVTIGDGEPYVAWVADSGGANAVPLHLGTAVAGGPVGLGSSPWAVAVSPDGVTAYVLDSTAATLTPITVASGSAGTAVSLAGCTAPKGLAIAPNGARAWISCSGNAKVVSVTLASGAVGSAISVGATPLGIAISPDGATAYVVSSGAGTLTPVATSSGAAGTPISLSSCTTPQAVAILPSGTKAYVACSGSNAVVPVTLASGSVGAAIGVGTTPVALAVGPGGSRVYAVDSGSDDVTAISVSTGSTTGSVSVGAAPRGIAIAPDGSTAYVTNSGDATVTPISLSTLSAQTPIAVGASPAGVAFVPDQAPAAALAVTPGAAGAATSFDASASTVSYGTIASYAWNFGDGATATTASPTTSHVYAAGCSYTVTLTETDSAGTSTTQVFTGQTATRNGSSAARRTATVDVSQALGFVSLPSTVDFSGTLTGLDQVLTSTLALDVGDGTATSGWSVSATSTRFSSGGASPHLLAADATTVQSQPTTACDGSAACVAPTNAVSYPYALPAGTTAPTATKLFTAAAGTGVCDQTVSTTFSLAVPSGAYAASYSSTWTFTVSSGP